MSRVLRRSESGATAVEYALMAALIALVIFGAVALVGTNLNAMWVELDARWP